MGGIPAGTFRALNTMDVKSNSGSSAAAEEVATGLRRLVGQAARAVPAGGVLGKGAMGKVFRAHDTTLDRHVALKTLPKVFKTSQYEIAAEQLIREARSAATIEHPHVVQIYEAGEFKGVYYVAMELLEGGSLHDLVKAVGQMDAVRACQLVAEAAEGLDDAQRAGDRAPGRQAVEPDADAGGAVQGSGLRAGGWTRRAGGSCRWASRWGRRSFWHPR